MERINTIIREAIPLDNNTVRLIMKPNWLAKGFTTFPNSVFESKLTYKGRLTLLALLSFAFGKKDSCFPSAVSLGKRVGLSERGIRRGLTELEKDSFLIRQSRKGKTNLFILKIK